MCNSQQDKLKRALNNKVLCNMNLEDIHVKIDGGGQLSKGGHSDCEKYKQPKNEKCGSFTCVNQNCDADVKHLNCQCGK